MVDGTQWTILSLLAWGSKFLEARGFSTPRLDCELLLGHVLGFKRIELYTNFERPVSNVELASLKVLLERRLANEPIAYIIGTKSFMGHSFVVNSDVLIPRCETEILVERVSDYIRQTNLVNPRILEIGVGSGCIGLSLLKEHKDAWLTGIDLSAAAIRVAEKNAARLGLASDRHCFVSGNALLEETWRQIGQSFSIIVSNPPYIADSESEDLPCSVKDYEPHMALFAGDDGLEFYRSLASFGAQVLAPTGRLFVELGYQQGHKVSALFAASAWHSPQLTKDYCGHIRVWDGCHDS